MSYTLDMLNEDSANTSATIPAPVNPYANTCAFCGEAKLVCAENRKRAVLPLEASVLNFIARTRETNESSEF